MSRLTSEQIDQIIETLTESENDVFFLINRETIDEGNLSIGAVIQGDANILMNLIESFIQANEVNRRLILDVLLHDSAKRLGAKIDILKAKKSGCIN